ncbi:hypothetical protein V5F38_03740 [Xanthobacter sp. V0B-10]|uniref:hypothetical protein n=1 Tax=Xanthobacter albus TaxID=3119929 RepID=UPI003729A87F
MIAILGCSSFVPMNATDSLLIPLTDAGCLTGLKHGVLGARYRFWRDGDGVRHVFSVYPVDAAPDYPDAVAIVARRTPAGSLAMWAGPSGAEARRMAERLDADEIHIHVLGEEPAPGLRRLLAPSPALPAVQRPARLPVVVRPCALQSRHAA